MQEVTPGATYTWSWGDNSSDIVGVGNKSQSHTYIFPGPYTISVTAIGYDETFSAQRSLIILGRPFIKIFMIMFICPICMHVITFR